MSRSSSTLSVISRGSQSMKSRSLSYPCIQDLCHSCRKSHRRALLLVGPPFMSATAEESWKENSSMSTLSRTIIPLSSQSSQLIVDRMTATFVLLSARGGTAKCLPSWNRSRSCTTFPSRTTSLASSPS